MKNNNDKYLCIYKSTNHPTNKKPCSKNIDPHNHSNTAMKSPGESTPFLFYIITPKMERQYLTVDSSIRQDKSG